MASRAVLTLILLAAAVSVSYAVSGLQLNPSASDTSSSARSIHSSDAETVLSSLTDKYSVGSSSQTMSFSSRTVYTSTSTTTVPELFSSSTTFSDSYASSHSSYRVHSTDSSKAFTKEVFQSETRTVLGTALKVEPLDIVATASFSSSTRAAAGTTTPVSLPETVAASRFESSRYEVAGSVLLGAQQRTVSDLEPEAVFGDGKKELIIASRDTILSKISVTDDTRDPKISLQNLLVNAPDGRKAATYPNVLDIGVSSGVLEAAVLIPQGATLTGPPDWDGVVDLPRFVDLHASPSGTVTSSIYVGLEGARLDFDKPVRISFYDRAGHAAAFEEGGHHTVIDTACAADEAGAVEAQLGGTGECRIDAGQDLAVWTYHMTRFYTLLMTPTIEEPTEPEPAQIRRGGGGGGGGSVAGAGTGEAVPVYIRSVSWDCEAEEVIVEAGPQVDGLSVTVLSKTLGLNTAELDDDAASPGYGLFVAPMDAEDDFIQVKALSVGGRDFASATESMNLDSCAGSRTFQTGEPIAPVVAIDATPKTEAQDPAAERAPEQRAIPEPATEPAASEPTIPEPAEPEPAAQPAELPQCGPGTVRGDDGTCMVQNGGGCLIATAAYGTELAPQVQALREVRNHISSTPVGSALLDVFHAAYYAVSPAIADMQRQNPALKQASLALLTPLLWSANIISAEPILLHGAVAAMFGAGAYVLARKPANTLPT